MEGGQNEELKSCLPLVGDIVVLLYESHFTLVDCQNKFRLNLTSNSLQYP